MKWPLFTTHRQLKEALKKCQEELEVQEWGIKKTNEAIKLLYKELSEKNKRLQELDQLKSEFVSTVSHELRTPLTTMKEFVSIIADEIPGKLNDEQKEYIGIIKSNIDRLTRLINDLLDISKIEAGRMELRKSFVNVIDLAEEVVSILRPKADEKGLVLKASFQTPIPQIYVDPDRIIQVFTNLIGNAIRFTPEGGEITVGIMDKPDEVECSVSDTGVGIASESLDKTFVRFQQFNRKIGPGARGTGLGLAITKELVNMHHGEIWVESEVGKGSKFIFTLPKHTAEELFVEHIDAKLKEAAKKGSKASLLVISIANFNELKLQLSNRAIGSILKEMEEILRNNQRGTGDFAMEGDGEIVVFLDECDKAHTSKVKDRLRQVLQDYLAGKKLEQTIELRVGYATYPDDAENSNQLIRKAKEAGQSDTDG